MTDAPTMEQVVAAQGITTRIVRVDPKSLRLLEVNARYMRHEQFHRLVENVARDGALTSVPFAARDDDGGYTVLSGNHRVMAAIEAGLTEIDVMITEDPLSPEQRLAIQLSHNAIVGQDDPQVLRQLYDSLADLDMRLYSGLDDKTLSLLEETTVPSLREAQLNYAVVSLMFLPEEKAFFDEVLGEAKKATAGSDRHAARFAEFSPFLDLLDLVGKSFNVKNSAVIVNLIIELVQRHLDELRDGWLDEAGEPKFGGGRAWVPMATILERGDMPIEAAAVVERAVKRMVDKGDVPARQRWKALELLAADYLASV